MLIQTSQMHQLLMHGLAVAALLPLSVGPAPAPSQVRLRGVWVGKGTKEGAEGPFQGCSGEQDHNILLWDPQGAAVGWSQPGSEQPFGVLGGLNRSSDSSEPIQTPRQSFSPAGKSQDPLEAQPHQAGRLCRGLPFKKSISNQNHVKHFISLSGNNAAFGAGLGCGC